MPAGRFAQTNHIGECRLFGLPPGQYYVTVNMPMTAAFVRLVQTHGGGGRGAWGGGL